MSFREALKSLVSDAHLFQYAEVNSTTSNIEKNTSHDIILPKSSGGY